MGEGCHIGITDLQRNFTQRIVTADQGKGNVEAVLGNVLVWGGIHVLLKETDQIVLLQIGDFGQIIQCDIMIVIVVNIVQCDIDSGIGDGGDSMMVIYERQ
jgi:hypothetical protein